MIVNENNMRNKRKIEKRINSYVIYKIKINRYRNEFTYANSNKIYQTR